MVSNLIDKIEETQLKKNIPEFRIGDTVDVHVKIVEGDKQRVQIFNGTVIARKGKGINESFTVRRIVNNEGVERIFPLHSPSVANVDVKRSGFTRRSKLYFLRKRAGKAVRLREVWTDRKK
ncbi:MAG: 50S ribosomal protein L19 [Sedimentisphaerales bacterium]|nr:50S ribosomal protein L19 [Sedimentisphaerales bacterium]